MGFFPECRTCSRHDHHFFFLSIAFFFPLPSPVLFPSPLVPPSPPNGPLAGALPRETTGLPSSPSISDCHRRSAVTNDSELTEFLESSLRVPDLVLPDPLFPKEIPAGNPPAIDFRSLVSAEAASVAKLLESASAIGCFQLVNRGIGGDVVGSARTAAAEIFQIPGEKKKAAARSPEMMYGFEEEAPEMMT